MQRGRWSRFRFLKVFVYGFVHLQTHVLRVARARALQNELMQLDEIGFCRVPTRMILHTE